MTRHDSPTSVERTKLSIRTCWGRWRAWRTTPGKLLAVRHYFQSNLCSDLLAADALCTSESAIRPISMRQCDYTFCDYLVRKTRYVSPARRVQLESFFHGAVVPVSLARGRLVLLDDEESWDYKEAHRGAGRIPVNSSGDDTPRRFRRRERTRHTIAVGFAADRSRGRETCGTAAETAAAGISWLLHRHWVKGEQNREIIDFHFLRSLSLSFSLFVSRFPRTPSPVPSRSPAPFNSVLPSSSSSQNDSTSAVPNRSCARERLLSRTYLLPVFRNPGTPLPGILARFTKPRCDLHGCDCMPHRLVSGKSENFFSVFRAILELRTNVLNVLLWHSERDTIYWYYHVKRGKRQVNILNL